jgi:hypothetical protein
MSVTTTRARLSAMGAFIAGITHSFTDIPRVVQDAQLPALIVVPRQATYNIDYGEGTVGETRLYQLLVLVQRLGEGTEKQAQVSVDPFFQRVRDYFIARPQLELDGAAEPQTVVYNAMPLGDAGFQVIPYPAASGTSPGVDYAGFILDLQVEEFSDISYQD